MSLLITPALVDDDLLIDTPNGDDLFITFVSYPIPYVTLCHPFLQVPTTSVVIRLPEAVASLAVPEVDPEFAVSTIAASLAVPEINAVLEGAC